MAVPASRKPLRTKGSTKLISMRGLVRRFRIVPGERISPNAIVWSSTTKKVAFGDTLGVPSGAVVPTNPSSCSSTIRFISAVSMFGSAISQFALPGVPVFFEIDDQLIAEMTERLLESVCRQVPAKCFQRLGLLSDRLAIGAGTDDTRP